MSFSKRNFMCVFKKMEGMPYNWRRDEINLLNDYTSCTAYIRRGLGKTFPSNWARFAIFEALWKNDLLPGPIDGVCMLWAAASSDSASGIISHIHLIMWTGCTKHTSIITFTVSTTRFDVWNSFSFSFSVPTCARWCNMPLSVKSVSYVANIIILDVFNEFRNRDMPENNLECTHAHAHCARLNVSISFSMH